MLGLDLGEGEFGRSVVRFQSLYASVEGIEGEGPGLIGIGESLPLPRQFLESAFSLPGPDVLVGWRRALPLDPRC